MFGSKKPREEKRKLIISYKLVLTLQNSRTNNKRVISTFKFGYPYLTVKEGPKVKTECIRRFLAHDFL